MVYIIKDLVFIDYVLDKGISFGFDIGMDWLVWGDYCLFVMYYNMMCFLWLFYYVENVGVIIYIEIEINFYLVFVGVIWYGVL